jgi:hypothetical protein
VSNPSDEPDGPTPEWLRPIEYNDPDDGDEEPVGSPSQEPAELARQEAGPPPIRYWFENLTGAQEWFDFGTLARGDCYFGNYPPHQDKVVYKLPACRWVLGFLDGLPGTATSRSSLAPVVCGGAAPSSQNENVHSLRPRSAR